MNTTYFLNLVAGNVFRSKTSPGIPSTYYLGLSSTAPNIGGTGVTEPSGGGYKRVAITNLTAPSNGVVSNSNDINFAESTAAWGVMSHYVIYDAETGGNLLMYDVLNAKRTVEESTIMTVLAGALTLSAVNV